MEQRRRRGLRPDVIRGRHLTPALRRRGARAVSIHGSVGHQEAPGRRRLEPQLQRQPARHRDHGDHEQVRTPLGYGEAMVADWQGAGLVKESVLKPVFTTIEQSLVIRVMGHLSAGDIKTLREVVADVIG